jgi:O-antigen ligase
MVLFWAKFGRKKSFLMAVAVLPLVFVLFAGRQTSLDTAQGTGQRRIQLWNEGLTLLIHSPFLGIGTSQYEQHVGQVAHNSFIHAFTELGFFGGALYLGAFVYALTSLARLGARGVQIRDPQVARLRPYILAALASYTICEFSLTHCYLVPTYGMLALATVCINLADPEGRLPHSRLGGRFFMRIFCGAAVFIVIMFIYVKVSLRY